MKKNLTLILAFLIVLTSFSLTSYANNNLLDFENGTSTIGGAVIDNPYKNFNVSNKVLDLTTTSGGEKPYYYDFPALSGKIVLENEFYFTNPSYCSPMFFTDGVAELAKIMLESKGNGLAEVVVHGTGGPTWTSALVPLNKWNHIKAIIDTDTNTFDTYVNGKLVSSNLAFRDNKDASQVVTWGANVASANRTSYVDNIKAYSYIKDSNEDICFSNSQDLYKAYGNITEAGKVIWIDKTIKTNDDVLAITNAGGESHVFYDFEPLNGKITVSADYYYPSADWCAPIALHSGDASLFSIMIAGDGEIAIDGANLDFPKKYVDKSQWNNIKLIVDVDTDKLAVYSNNVLIQENVGFKNNATITELSKIGFRVTSNKTGYIDNISFKKYVPEVILSGIDTFDTPEGNSGLTGWYAQSAQIVTDPRNPNNKVLTNIDSGSIFKNFDAKSGVHTVKMKMMWPNANTFLVGPFIDGPNGNDSGVLKLMPMGNGTGSLYVNGGDMVTQPLLTNEWIEIISVVNTETKKVKLYIDGILFTGAEINFENLNETSFDKIQWHSGTGSSYYIDDVEIIDGDYVPPVTVFEDFNINFEEGDLSKIRFLELKNGREGGIVTNPKIDSQNSSNNVLKLKGATENGTNYNTVAYVDFAPLSGKFVYEGKMYLENNSFTCAPYFGNNITDELISIMPQPDGVWIANGGELVEHKPALVAQIWNTIKVVGDTDTDTFSVYFNGVLAFADLPMASKTNEITKIRFESTASGANTPGVYLDDIKLSQISDLKVENVLYDGSKTNVDLSNNLDVIDITFNRAVNSSSTATIKDSNNNIVTTNINIVGNKATLTLLDMLEYDMAYTIDLSNVHDDFGFGLTNGGINFTTKKRSLRFQNGTISLDNVFSFDLINETATTKTVEVYIISYEAQNKIKDVYTEKLTINANETINNKSISPAGLQAGITTKAFIWEQENLTPIANSITK